MRQETIDLYLFNELSEEGKQKAIEKWRENGVDDFWSEHILDEDAKRIELSIIEFCLDHNTIKVEFISTAQDCAENIYKEHGEHCDTYKEAKAFLSGKIDEDEFKRQIAECYLIILRKDYEFYLSEEYISETMEANEYEFTSAGDIY